MRFFAYAGHHVGGGGLGHVLSTLAHAALWSMVGRFIWHAPVLVVLVCAGLAAAWLLHSRRSRR